MAEYTEKVDPNVKKEADKLEKNPYENLEKQIQAEYQLAYDHQKPKKDEWLVRLKLYNNQRRDKKAVGDTTLFSIQQTVLASLYMDKLSVQFTPREPGDEDQSDNVTLLAANDYDEMGKDELDYYWDWDACFFGRGLVSLSEYIRDPEKKIYVPVPENIDPITFLRDPRAISVNGNRMGRGAARFFGREIRMTKQEMIDHPAFFDDTAYGEIKFGTSTNSLLDDAAQARADAQGNQFNKMKEEKNLGENAEYELLEWCTHWKGKKCKVWTANKRKRIVGFQELKNQDVWPLIDRPLYASSNDWDGTSIPDLVEDKQRARAVAQNLGLDAMKADLHPMYIYNTNAVKNRNDLNFGFNKFIPVDGAAPNQIVPLQKSFNNMGLLNFIYQTLDQSAQKATASPELKQGATPQQDRTLGEQNILVNEANTRLSLSAKVFGWSEKRFWRQWYQCYKDNFKENIDEKVLRLTGQLAGKWRPLRKENLFAKIDPDIVVDSAALAQAKQDKQKANLTGYFGFALSDPLADRRYGMIKLAEVNGMSRDEINQLFPPTIDELVARDENDKLSNNEYVQVKKDDDHNVHFREHKKAADTKETYAHVEAHKLALTIKKTNPEFFPADQQQPATLDSGALAPGGAPAPVQAGTPGGQQAAPPAQTSPMPAPQKPMMTPMPMTQGK